MGRPPRYVGRAPVCLLILAAATLLDPAPAAGQAAGRGRVTADKTRGPAATWRLLHRPELLARARIARAAVTEVEPNDSPATAMDIAIGDTINGHIDPPGDVDFFAIQLAAGDAVEFEIAADRNGSPLDAIMLIFAPDGETALAGNDDAVGLDPRFTFTAATAGRYFLAVLDYSVDNGGPDYFYQLQSRPGLRAPGDPTTLVAAGLSIPWSAAAVPGALYVLTDRTISRVQLNGTVTQFAGGLNEPKDIAVDAAGNVLVADQLPNGTWGLLRIAPNGTRSNFASGLQGVAAVTVGPDGAVWLADDVRRRLVRFPPGAGNPTEIEIGTAASALMKIAFSPAGELYFSNFSNGIFRVRNGAVERVITLPGVGGLAFDRAGNLYVGTVQSGIVMYDANHGVVHAPFAASGLDLTGHVVFAVDAAGQTTSRLLGINLGLGTIVEVNPAGVVAPGQPVGGQALQLTLETLRGAVMGAPYADTLRSDATGAVTWSLVSGALPGGVTLNATTGVLSGVPEVSGSFPLGVQAASGGRIGGRTYTLVITRPAVNTTTAANHLLGDEQLDADLLRFLDLQGNRNGRFDIGDLQAYLRTTPGARVIRDLPRERQP